MRRGTGKMHLIGKILLFMLIVSTPTVFLDVASASDNDEVLARIMRDWQSRRHAMSRVRYVINGTRLIPKGTLTEVVRYTRENVAGDVPPRDDVAKTSLDVLIDFAQNRYRIEEHEPPQPGFDDDLNRRTSYRVRLFDGESQEEWYPEADDTHIQLMFAPRARGFLEPYLLPLSFAHGYVDPNGGFSRVLQEVRLDPGAFSVHSKSVQDGKEVVVLRSPKGNTGKSSWCEWWVDLQRQSAVTRVSHYVDASHRLRAFEIEYAQHGRVWLPTSWRIQTYSADERNELLRMREYTVNKIVTEPPVRDTMFSKRKTPGMIVRDGATGRTYVVAKDGSPGPDFAPIQRSRVITHKRGAERARNRWVWTSLLIIGLVLLGVAAFYGAGRRLPGRKS